MQERRLEGRVCVVAGAMGDMGEAVARRFADEGGIVVGIDRRPHAVGELSLMADLTDEDAVAAAYASVAEGFGRLDVLYNNAGPLDPDDHSALDTTLETWNRVMALILTATWLSCKHAIPHMGKGASAGSIINTASFLAGMGAATGQMAFNAAKAGVEQLSRDLGVHLARRNIRVNALAIGPIETRQIKATFERLGPEQAERRFTHMPMGRFGTLAELAATAAYLASDDAGFVTAASFPLNGGIPGAFTVPDLPPRQR
ncbi:3-oxoacyl-ACP reductase [Aureimonas endophytica]|uniref:3-oxoacyl-ACP reductase n=1 Tax=Aureimonas endophytica TaxID=2027858 RepID=A0A917E4Q8_9HYPH|nr:SDR family oxidoreductase [Aureimonas endophytica]GGE03412.1 3-oxoacyl-ACP reductase [Aureimonas endophytica]